MTAEIAVLNAHAIAMAADTKMSSVSLRGEPLHRDGYRKLFSLSDVHPVGIMIHGGSHYAFDTPWEVLIREYKFHKGEAAHDTVEAWAEDFLEFVKAYGNGDKDAAGVHLRYVVDDFFRRIEEHATAKIEPGDTAAFARHADNYMNAASHWLAKFGPLMTSAETKLLRKRYTTHVWDVATRPFCVSDQLLLDKAQSLAWGAISSALFSRAHSGIVIGGFGSKQRFPALCAYKIEGYLGTVFKSCPVRTADLNAIRTAEIIPFAQSNMMKAFATGMDQDSASYFASEILSEFTSFAELSATCIATSAVQAEAMRTLAKGSQLNIKCKLEAYIDYRTESLVETVEGLNDVGLQAFARALIALESTRHLYNDRTPSVGGGIDVLVMRNTDRHVRVEHGPPVL